MLNIVSRLLRRQQQVKTQLETYQDPETHLHIQQQSFRLSGFLKKIKRFHTSRRAGVNTTQMVQAAGTPAVTYGVDVMGSGDPDFILQRNIHHHYVRKVFGA